MNLNHSLWDAQCAQQLNKTTRKGMEGHSYRGCVHWKGGYKKRIKYLKNNLKVFFLIQQEIYIFGKHKELLKKTEERATGF